MDLAVNTGKAAAVGSNFHFRRVSVLQSEPGFCSSLLQVARETARISRTENSEMNKVRCEYRVLLERRISDASLPVLRKQANDTVDSHVSNGGISSQEIIRPHSETTTVS